METTTDIVQSFYDGLAAGDLPRAFERFAARIDWWQTESASHAQGNPYTTAAAVVEGVLLPIGRDWEGFRVEVERVIGDGETVIALGQYSGVHRRSRKSLAAPFAHAWTVRDGQILAFREYVDTKLMERAAVWTLNAPFLTWSVPGSAIQREAELVASAAWSASGPDR